MDSLQNLIVFDLDGTLVDSCRDLALAVNLMRGHFHLDPLPLDTIRGYVGNGVRALVSRSLAGTRVDVDVALPVQAELYRAHLTDQTELYPGVDEGLRGLKRSGHVLAVATNKPAEACDLILQHFNIRGLFACVLAGGTYPKLKPDPGMLLEIMTRTGIAPEASWMVGDNDTDLEAARRAGIRSIFLTYGYGSMGQETPTVLSRSFPEALSVFKS